MKRAGQGGAALLMVLGFIGLISLLLVGLSQLISYDIEQELSWAKDYEARLLAESGLAIAMHPQIEDDDPVLSEFATNEFDEGFTVEIRSEQSFININWLLTNENEDYLYRLFESWGMTRAEIERLLDKLFDWVDQDDDRRRQGAEIDDYREAGKTPYPPNREIREVDELRYVMGIERMVELKPDWRDVFTVHGDGKLDINDADSDLIRIAADLDELTAGSIDDYRNGPDREPLTDDDREFESVSEFAQYLGLTGLTAELEEVLTAESAIRRIVSTGRIGNYEKRIRVVSNQDNVDGKFLEYREE
jgi:general secretion pathway protein K